MYNDENQKINSADYLNQIAPHTTKKTDFLRQKPVMIGAVVLVAFTILMIIAAIVGGMSGGTTPLKTLTARLTSTDNTVSSATENLKSTKLRALNSNLKIYLTNTIRDYTPILAAEKIDVKKIDSKITLTESNTKLLALLEDARLNARYDAVYAREMSYQLEKVMNLMNEILKTTKKENLKIFLKDSYNNLEPIQKQFADYNVANN